MYVEQQQDILEEPKRKREPTFSWLWWLSVFGSTKVRKCCALLMLIFLIGIIIVTVTINHKISYKVNELSSKKNEVDSLGALFQGDVKSNQFHNKRVARSLARMSLPNEQGYLNIFVRESCRDNREYPFQQMRFPYVRYDRQLFRFGRSWVRFSKWYPIYADRYTRQTVIYSRAGVYILPPMINSNGQLISIAELLAYGYATLLSNGAITSSYSNLAYYARPGAYYGRGIPRFSPQTGGYMGGINTKYRSYFKPECGNQYEEDVDENYSPPDDEDGYENLQESPEDMNEVRKPRRRSRPTFSSNVNTLSKN